MGEALTARRDEMLGKKHTPTEIMEFKRPDVLAIMEKNYTSKGRLCGHGDAATADKIVKMVQIADEAYGFSCSWHTSGRADHDYQAHEFLVDGCRLSLLS